MHMDGAGILSDSEVLREHSPCNYLSLKHPSDNEK